MLENLPRLRKNLDGDTFLEFLDDGNDAACLKLVWIGGVYVESGKNGRTVLLTGAAAMVTQHSYSSIMDLVAPLSSEDGY